MRQFTKNVVAFLKAENGPTAVEYAVMLALVIAVCIGTITVVGTSTNTTYRTAKNAMPGGS
jgi:pilus assembly protein Flp/PilA